MGKLQTMNTEDIQLDIKQIFQRKREVFTPQDVARMRYLCRIFVETMIEFQREFRGTKNEP